MREFCLLSKTGTVINMALTSGKPPALTEHQVESGWRWEPVENVSQFALRQYHYWNERP